jgi:hypothetical protein
MEYDNLIYYSAEHLENINNGIYFTQVGPQCGSAGFMINKGEEHISKFINRLTQILNKGENVLRSYVNYDQLSEMIMIDAIHKYTTDIHYLPLFKYALYRGLLFIKSANL